MHFGSQRLGDRRCSSAGQPEPDHHQRGHDRFWYYLSKTTKNFWLGIRAPWTLTSDEVWLKTHRLAGVLFVGAGFVDLAVALSGGSRILSALALLVALVTAVIAAYVFHRRLEQLP